MIPKKFFVHQSIKILTAHPVACNFIGGFLGPGLAVPTGIARTRWRSPACGHTRLAVHQLMSHG